MDAFDPAATLSPDDPLQAWLQDPAMAEFVKQKAKEHASSLLGYTEPDVPPQPYPGYRMPERGLDPNVPSLRMDDEFTGTPNKGPLGNIGTAIGVRDPNTGEVIVQRLDPAATQRWRDETPLPVPPAATPKPVMNALDPVPEPAAEPVPEPRERPTSAEGSTDVSAARKKPELADKLGDFGKTLAGVKPIAPPPLNAVGTPSVRSPSAIAMPQIAQILQLMGAQSKPDPLQTLGRLLVAGKA